MIKKAGLIFIFLIGVITLFNLEQVESLLIAKFIHQTDQEIHNEIELKKNITMALGISVAHNPLVKNYLVQQEKIDLAKLSALLRQKTSFKNIWYRIVDTNGTIIYSTTALKHYRRCRRFFYKKKKYITDLIIDCYGLHFAAFVPIKNGYLLTLGQFNSIKRDLQRFGVHSMVVLDKKYFDYSKEVYHAIGSYKILDEKIDPHMRDLLLGIDLDTFIQKKGGIVYQEHIIQKYPLKNSIGETLGWIIYMKEKHAIFASYISANILFIIISTGLAIILVIAFFVNLFNQEKSRIEKRRREYYQNILNNLQEIVFICDEKKIKYTNEKFYHYFGQVEDVGKFVAEKFLMCEDLLQEHECKKVGFTYETWLRKIVNKNYYIVVNIQSNRYVFGVKISSIDEKDFVIILVDITQEYMRQKELAQIAIEDALTGLYNRYAFNQIAREKMRESRYLHENLLFVLLDVDHFKQINDTYGHDVGDEVLRELAALMKKHFRKSDPIFRIGGEEFAILLETSDVSKALQILQELRQKVEQHRFKGIQGKVTISIGVAKYDGKESLEHLYQRADRALYEAKRGGRNRVVYKGEEDAR